MERRAAGAGARSLFYETLLNKQTEQEDELNRRARCGQFRSAPEELDGDDRSRDNGEDDNDALEEELDEEELFETEDTINLEAFDVPVQEWITQDQTRREVIRKFRLFFINFQEDHYSEEAVYLRKRKRRYVPPFYEDHIRTMCSSNLAILEVSYIHLMQEEPIIARWIYENPKDTLLLLNEGTKRQTLRWFPSYSLIQNEIFVRIADIPTSDSLRYIRSSHLDKLI